MRTLTPVDTVEAYFHDIRRVLADTPREAILANVHHLYQAWERRKQVFVLGNGGSASTASHIGNDLSKATIVPGMPRLKVISIADNVALMTAWANDSSYDAMFREQLENLLEPGDVVIGISCSGNSPNVLQAMEFAAERGAVTIGWTGLSGGRLKDIVDCCVHTPTDDVGMIESVHLVIDHMITNALKQCIEAKSIDAAYSPDLLLSAPTV
jgi:D-sedoheptulose 7-phosphate isomerase